MFTDCPGCSRQFHIYAIQLTAAKGLVKCGFCGQQFNAIERLHDKPLPIIDQQHNGNHLRAQHEPLPHEAMQPRFPVPDSAEGPLENGTLDTPGAESVSYVGAFPVGIQPQSYEPPQPQFPLPDSAEETPENGATEPPGADPVFNAGPLPVDAEPQQQRPEEDNGQLEQVQPPQEYAFNGDDRVDVRPSRPGMVLSLFWTAGVLLLTVVAITQLAWFNRDQLLSRYPAMMPWVIRLCDRMQCQVFRHRDVAAIKLINRDVRDHPRYEHALLVNATMSSQSDTFQPYPEVQLLLYDTNGKMVAHRKFHPQDYLDDSVQITAGMAPNRLVHFVLEVTGMTARAVSFEFNFL
ncbi:MAG: DUF3426 domain-containing protein [Gammaproteobacteria bacterium]